MLPRSNNARLARLVGVLVACSVCTTLMPRPVVAVVMPAALTKTAADHDHISPSQAIGQAIAPATPVQTSRLVVLQVPGYLRIRSQWLRNGGLGDGGSGTPNTLRRLGLRPDGADMTLLDARFRVNPSLILGSRARVDAQFDVTGGLIFGAKSGVSSKDGISTDKAGPLAGMFGNTPTRDLLAVRRAWATFDLFGLAELVIGRMGDHFGLGILRNDGRDPLADFQTDVDRVGVRANLFGMRLWVSRDSLATLPMIATDNQGDDLRYGIQGANDVVRYLAQVEGGVEKRSDKGLRWGVAVGYHAQTLALRREHEDDTATALGIDCAQAGTCVRLVPREALLIVPQGTVDWHGDTDLGDLRAEAEVVLRVGRFANTDALPKTDTSMFVAGGAFAGRLTLKRTTQDWQLRLGYASGDSSGGFGVLDRANLAVIDPVTKELVHRRWLTGMAMNRGYLVGGLLFREIIGAVANAWYVRPAWRYHVLPTTATQGLSIELACLVAGAAQWGATPGKRTLLGLEPALQVDARLGQWGRTMVQASTLLPGPAFDAGLDGVAAPQAWRLSAAWIVDF